MLIEAHPQPTTQRIPGSIFAQALIRTLIAATQAPPKPKDGIGGA